MMNNRTAALRNLLAGELPLERVGPRLRQEARRALTGGDSGRLLGVARVVVGELLRRGDLLRVAVETESGGRPVVGTLCLLKGTHRVVDIGPVFEGEAAHELPADFPALRRADASAAHVAMPDVAGVLGAMEDAQDLDIGDPQSGEKGTILAGILRLLGKFTPQFRLHIELPESTQLPEQSEGVFTADGAERPLWQDARRPGQPVWIPNAGELPAAVRRRDAAETPEPFAAVCAVAVPLWEDPAPGEGREPVEAGILYLVAAEDWGRESLLRLAERLSRFVTRRWLYQQDVNQRIHTDSLTGVFNRAYFDTQFTLELERARRSDVPLTLVICDLDHFKRVNDRYGHQAGDRTLQMVAHRLQEELRRIDHICRIGGEEFALILPATGLDAAHDVVQRLLDARFSIDVVGEAGPEVVDVTFSFGGATYPSGGTDAFELFRKSDAMLYLSKDLGRNQCHFWNPTGDHVRLAPGSAAS